MTEQEVKELLTKYGEGRCTPQEKAWIEQWYEIEAARQRNTRNPTDPTSIKAEIWESVQEMSGIADEKRRRHRIHRRYAVAASLIIIFSIGLHFYRQNQPAALVQAPAKPAPTNDADPAIDKAVLTLADGSKIILNDSQNGLIAQQSGISISKTADGSVVYQVDKLTTNEEITAFNTIETPKGGKYQIILPDGSKVWLNAASSLKFPTMFRDGERRVSLSGEAYFEVAKDKSKPFRVHTSDMIVNVTGTQFNVMAYNDEGYTATTLVEGSVDIDQSGKKLMLTPGEQAVSKKGSDLTKARADVNQVIAWKNGLFHFSSSDVPSVMRQLGRWYDISVEYRGEIPKYKFGGYISRDSKLSQVVRMLELSGIQFTIENKKIIVLPQK